MAFELVAEPHLLRRDEAERRVVDLQIAGQRRQAQPIGAVGSRRRSAVGSDLLDVHRRRERVERQATRIDDADAFQRKEPQSSIRSLCDVRAERSRVGAAPHPVRAAETVGRIVRSEGRFPSAGWPTRRFRYAQFAPDRTAWTARNRRRHPRSSNEPRCTAVRRERTAS